MRLVKLKYILRNNVTGAIKQIFRWNTTKKTVWKQLFY